MPEDFLGSDRIDVFVCLIFINSSLSFNKSSTGTMIALRVLWVVNDMESLTQFCVPAPMKTDLTVKR